MAAVGSAYFILQPRFVEIKNKIVRMRLRFYGAPPSAIRVQVYKIIDRFQSKDFTKSLFDESVTDEYGQALNVFPVYFPTVDLKPKISVNCPRCFLYFEISRLMDNGTYSHVVNSDIFFVTGSTHIYDEK
jgi:hypothetical protein